MIRRSHFSASLTFTAGCLKGGSDLLSTSTSKRSNELFSQAPWNIEPDLHPGGTAEREVPPYYYTKTCVCPPMMSAPSIDYAR